MRGQKAVDVEAGQILAFETVFISGNESIEWSIFLTIIAIGLPIVTDFLKPDNISTASRSIFMRLPLPYPCIRRQRSSFISASSIFSPAGIPSSIVSMHFPCDSPLVR